MIDYNELVRKIRSMSAHDIIMSMVNGLRNPRTRIDMSTFGYMEGSICFGCAATNAILHIMNANEDEVESHVSYRPIHIYPPVRGFELAINRLRMGEVDIYNEWAKAHGFAQITPIPGQELPRLRDDYTEEQLQEYVKLAKYQLTTKTQNND